MVLIDGEKLDPPSFKSGAVSLLLLNVEEERLLRPADPYTRTMPDGSSLRVQPELRLDLHLLFVARFKEYWQAWEQLSQVIRLFQARRVLDRQSAPGMPEGVEKLVLELVSLDSSARSELWGALRCAQHPSVFYKAKMLAFLDEHGSPVRVIEEVEHLEGRMP